LKNLGPIAMLQPGWVWPPFKWE